MKKEKLQLKSPSLKLTSSFGTEQSISDSASSFDINNPGKRPDKSECDDQSQFSSKKKEKANISIPKASDKVWVLYINGEPQDWQQICEKGNITVSKKDKLLWKYEYPQKLINAFKKKKDKNVSQFKLSLQMFAIKTRISLNLNAKRRQMNRTAKSMMLPDEKDLNK